MPTTATSIEEMDLPRVDVLGEAFTADPLGVLDTARIDGDGMAKSHRGVEFLSYRWVGALLNDDRFHTVDVPHFRQKGAPDSLLHFVEDGLLLSMEKERHDRVRRVLARAFTLRRVDEQRELMRSVAQEWIAPWADDARCDLVDDFTQHYPMVVLCRVIGVPPADIPRFVEAAHDLHLMAAVPMAPGFAEIDEALATLEAYVLDIVERRRVQPEADFLSGLVEAQALEGDLSQSELVGNVVNLLFAGAGTTRYQLASAVRAFLEQDLWERLAADPELVTPALEEAMRFYPVTQFVVRIPYEDVVIDDKLFPARRRIILNLVGASRDPEMFPEPDRFDLTRDNVARSRLPFGWGSHLCLGHALARANMREAVVELTSRFRDLEITGDLDLASPAAMLRGPEHLPLSFRPR
jgi:cytochrome P450